MATPVDKAAKIAAQQPHSEPAPMEAELMAAEAQEASGQKYTKDEVSYRSAGKSPTRCVFCAFYQPGYGTNSCAQVEGPIKPGDVCDLYKPANASPQNPASTEGSIADLVGPQGSA